ncbi:MAG: NAD(P)(+) transhydrogenase (Re/Si-specific) subunit beta [Deltaproteobacteria bacterium]|nr:MAG: NAD(P)(+) transhydrogenase (Re/Si-specific) subunit beta [Deltaproteobacteria bacterium]
MTSSISYLVHAVYLFAFVMLLFGVKQLSRLKTARRGNLFVMFATALAMGAALFDLFLFHEDFNPMFIMIGGAAGALLGVIIALRTKAIKAPQAIALFNAMGGAASALVALSLFAATLEKTGGKIKLSLFEVLTPQEAISLALAFLFGWFALAGSLFTFGRMRGASWAPKKPMRILGLPLVQLGLFAASVFLAYVLVFLATSPWEQGGLLFAIALVCTGMGFLLLLPIARLDLTTVLSLLNAYTGLAAALTGFLLHNPMLMMGGALVGSASYILTVVMCRNSDRSLLQVLLGGVQAEEIAEIQAQGHDPIQRTDAEEVAVILGLAKKVIVVPGYGMALSQAQHALHDLTKLLQARKCKVHYAIHPVAGRMPGHINLLLSEAHVPHHLQYEFDVIDKEFASADLAIVLGANDIVNPDAKVKKDSPIFGMPVFSVSKAKRVLVIKRSLSGGYSRMANPLFSSENTLMYLRDARTALEEVTKVLKTSDH